MSPLKKNKANPKPRRPTKFWTIEEVDALREGVKEYDGNTLKLGSPLYYMFIAFVILLLLLLCRHGKSWKYIKDANPVVFAERTEVRECTFIIYSSEFYIYMPMY